ncbi:hypothetical protein D3C78_1103520 [compost metagenome]
MQRFGVHFGLFPGLGDKTVGDQRYAAAFLPLEQLHADIHRIEHLDQILAQLRMVVINEAAVEERDLLGITPLGLRLLTVPAAEGTERVFGQFAAMVNLQRLVEQGTHRLKPGSGINNRRKWRRQRAHEIGMAEDSVTQRGLALGKVGAGALNDVADFDVGRAGHLTAFAVGAILQRLIIQRRILQSQALAVRPRLFWPRIERIHLGHRTIGGTDGTFDAILKTVVFMQAHGRSSCAAICCATYSAPISETPAPQPCCRGS